MAEGGAQDGNLLDPEAERAARLRAIESMSINDIITNTRILTGQSEEVDDDLKAALNARFDQIIASWKHDRSNVRVVKTDVDMNEGIGTVVKKSNETKRGLFDTHDIIKKCFANQEDYQGD